MLDTGLFHTVYLQSKMVVVQAMDFFTQEMSFRVSHVCRFVVQIRFSFNWTVWSLHSYMYLDSCVHYW